MSSNNAICNNMTRNTIQKNARTLVIQPSSSDANQAQFGRENNSINDRAQPGE
jgi:hypothetical protein